MRKIITLTHVSLDGVMQAPGGPHEDPSGGFAHGGWARRSNDPAVGDALRELMASDFDLLLGRRTYEIFAAYWPYAGEDFIANAFNRAAKFVVTQTLGRLHWHNSRPLHGDAAEHVRQLKATNGPDLHVWGSGQLLQTLMTADLIDELRLWIYPLVLGSGKRLFDAGLPPRQLTLLDSRRGSNGVFLNTYRPSDPLPRPLEQPDAPSAAERARRKKWAREESSG